MSVRRTALAFASAILLALASGLAGGCYARGPRHSQAHYACRQGCMNQRHACIVQSMNAPALQSCDPQLQTCIAYCPP